MQRAGIHAVCSRYCKCHCERWRRIRLLVDVDDTPSAGDHLHLYEQERLVRPPPPPPPPKLHPHALMGSIVYALVLYRVAYAISNGLWRLDAFDVGELDARLVQQGQWWRVWTALTLHMDILHLMSNMVFGIWFGYLASRLLGVGNAWLLVVLGAGWRTGSKDTSGRPDTCQWALPPPCSRLWACCRAIPGGRDWPIRSAGLCGGGRWWRGSCCSVGLEREGSRSTNRAPGEPG